MIQICKAKSKATDEWATGYLVKGYAGLRIDAFILPLKNISAYPSADLSRIWAEGIEVDASTICAYTGLADNLKCDIYEWDIVGGNDYIDGVFIVRFGWYFFKDSNYYGWYLDGKIQPTGEHTILPMTPNCHVMGNVFDNERAIKALKIITREEIEQANTLNFRELH